MQQISAPFAGVRELAASYWNATELGPVDTHCVRIGGHVIELRFGTPGLVKCIMPAFAHLRIGPGLASELVVDIWDSASTGACPPPIFDVDRDAPAGAFYFFEDESMRGVFQPGMRALSAVDFATDHAWYFVEDPAALPYWERAAPIRQILHWWMGSRGHQQVHSGAVGTPDGGVLLVGKGGSGKSTSALVSLNSELRYAGDDYTMVSLSPEPTVHSLYSSGKVHAENLTRLPHLVPALSNAGELATEKGVVFVDQHFPDRMIEGFPLRAIVMPTITGRTRTRVRSASRAAALAALAPSTVFQLHTAGSKALEYMARLVRDVPAYVLELGANVSDTPPVLLELLDDLKGAAS
ncbi:MAG TPA: hypothetical protein VK390_17215 [Propionibacteriaceae bacterium]|nr:hypothetical protein [Propionibacteriaceae bacterium]